MKKVFAICFLSALLLAACGGGKGSKAMQQGLECWQFAPPVGSVLDTVVIDTMDVKNPFICYERLDDHYYMVADGGYLWQSKDLYSWVGPYDVLLPDSASWFGKATQITSPEIHRFNGRYYYLATAETPGAAHRSCVVFAADRITGPYRMLNVKNSLLALDEMAAHPTFGIDYMNAAYMIYTRDSGQGQGNAMQIIRFSDDLERRVGEPYEMFTASQCRWLSGADENLLPVIEAPCLFATDEDGFGILFTTYVDGNKAIGVAYSETERYGYNGPWNVEPQPLLQEGVSSPSIFADYDGTMVLAVGKDTVIGGVDKCVPQLFKIDMQFEKLMIKGHYKF